MRASVDTIFVWNAIRTHASTAQKYTRTHRKKEQNQHTHAYKIYVSIYLCIKETKQHIIIHKSLWMCFLFRILIYSQSLSICSFSDLLHSLTLLLALCFFMWYILTAIHWLCLHTQNIQWFYKQLLWHL